MAQEKDLVLPPEISAASNFHIVFVRHAYPACSELQCDLNEEGHRQAQELALFISTAHTNGALITAAYASSACRTVLTVAPTANRFELSVQAFPARSGAPICEFLGDDKELQRPDSRLFPSAGISYAEAEASSRHALFERLTSDALTTHLDTPVRLVLVADHSNFLCEWFERLGVPLQDYAEDCGPHGLALTDYADLYWVYSTRSGDHLQWRLHHIENAFDRGIPNTYEANRKN